MGHSKGLFQVHGMQFVFSGPEFLQNFAIMPKTWKCFHDWGRGGDVKLGLDFFYGQCVWVPGMCLYCRTSWKDSSISFINFNFIYSFMLDWWTVTAVRFFKCFKYKLFLSWSKMQWHAFPLRITLRITNFSWTHFTVNYFYVR